MAMLFRQRLANARWPGVGIGVQGLVFPPLFQRRPLTSISGTVHAHNQRGCNGAGESTKAVAQAATPGSGNSPRFPTLEECRSQPTAYHEMSNDVLMILAAAGDHGARTERLIREVMVVGSCSWQDACAHVEQLTTKTIAGELELHRASRRFDMLAVPVSLGAGFASIPLVFNINVALWFNEVFVTADVPQEKDLETWLEVGAWTWNWMEPPLGTITFVLLCIQLSRSHMQALYGTDGWWACRQRTRRARALLEAHPQYNELVLLHWSQTLCTQLRKPEQPPWEPLHVSRF